MNAVESSNLPLLPLSTLLGISLVAAERDKVVATMEVRAELCTSGEILHGGALMSLADTLGAIGAWLNLPEGKGTTTLESKTNFLGHARLGSVVRAEATPIHVGRRTSVWQTCIHDDKGKLIGLVTQTQMILG